MDARGAPPPQAAGSSNASASAGHASRRGQTVTVAGKFDNAPVLPAAEFSPQGRGRLDFAGANAVAIVYETGRFIKCG